MTARLSADELDALRAFSTPTIANAIELFDVRPRTEGFMDASIVCRFPELGRICGYAVTATIDAALPPQREMPLRDVVRANDHVPRPWIAVIEDRDLRPVGSIWGEVNATAFRALGTVGAITNGGVRDLAEARALGFQFFSSCVLVSHAYAHFTSAGEPVNVGGLRVSPGDLLHADEHGVMSIPLEIARDLPAAAAKVEAAERRFFDYVRGAGFDRAEMLRRYEQID